MSRSAREFRGGPGLSRAKTGPSGRRIRGPEGPKRPPGGRKKPPSGGLFRIVTQLLHFTYEVTVFCCANANINA